MKWQSIASAWAFSRPIVTRSSAAAAGQFKAMANMAPPARHFISHSRISIFPIKAKQETASGRRVNVIAALSRRWHSHLP